MWQKRSTDRRIRIEDNRTTTRSRDYGTTVRQDKRTINWAIGTGDNKTMGQCDNEICKYYYILWF